MKTKWLNIIFVVAGSLVMLTVGASTYLSIQSQTEAISSLKQEKTKVESTIDKTTADYKEALASLEKSSGIDADTKAQDSQYIKKTLSKVFTWNTGSMYDSARADLISSLGADNALVSNFMPENIHVTVPDDLKDTIADNDIDLNGYKSKLKTIDTYNTSWKGDGSAQYTVVVSYQAYTQRQDVEDGKAVTNYVAITLTMSGSGDSRKMTNISISNLMDA